jgi:hypothetical protein
MAREWDEGTSERDLEDLAAAPAFVPPPLVQEPSAGATAGPAAQDDLELEGGEIASDLPPIPDDLKSELPAFQEDPSIAGATAGPAAQDELRLEDEEFESDLPPIPDGLKSELPAFQEDPSIAGATTGPVVSRWLLAQIAEARGITVEEVEAQIAAETPALQFERDEPGPELAR